MFSIIKTALIITVLAASIVLPKDMKIGFIRSDYIFSEVKETKDAQAKYDKEVAKWEQDAESKKKKLTELNDQLEKQGLLMSEAKKKELREQISTLYAEYQQFVQKIFGQGGEAYKKNTEFTKPILKKINMLLDEIGKAEGYDFIFDATSGGMVYAKEAYDLSDRIIKELNKGTGNK
ncbi:MAG: OmpH family outer membrane protein [Fibrobacteres bacterium]|nr:OmpH family outer membrane protein [Fibrobacterota bacterium]